MQDGYLVRFTATGAAIGAMAGALFGVSPMGPVWGLVIGTLGVFLWAWNRRFPGDPELVPATVPVGGEADADSGCVPDDPNRS